MWMLKPLLLGRESHLTRKTRGALTSSSTTLGREALVLAVDISIANPFSKVGGANPKPLAAALSREVEKVNKYAKDCCKLNLNFHPLVLDAYCVIPSQHCTPCSESPHQQGQELCVTQLGSTNSQGLLVPEALTVTLWTFNAYKVKPQSGNLLSRVMPLHLK